ncbi:CobW family GTP-binding protein [Natrialba asiatica]|uniref:Cobalamin synthesis protein P47K n=1 Tax=Natrialba asiatica (strain ATCC 700177 / DSM 12278 / JCM 9576 / FERM P-10747 / NBRC 102637 / 172P1) TaxID=29540 RepID=M0AYQ1_NATA1|nr:GTP-binding protein [Natrialba asiatica]ELZ03447.1 cobalamin synthesis protein P47K [Natrialba asiatica DSM 12278]
MASTTPVTILAGSLGAGKTTLLNHLLQHADGRDLAVLINDMGEVNVDAELVADGSELDVDDGIAELSNGCLCCELQDDLETAVVRLARSYEFDHLVVESSGISEPEPVARLFTTTSRVAARYDVDAIVTVLDTPLFIDTFAGEAVPERRTDPAAESDRPLSDLLIEQLEAANLILCNKTDRCEPAELAETGALLDALRPTAETIHTEFSAVDPDRVLGVDRFDPRADAQRGRDRQDHGRGRGQDSDHDRDVDHTHRHPSEAYGVDSFVFRARRPFHPDRFAALLRELPAAVVRSKGTVWVAGTDMQLSLSQAGPSVRLTATGPWIATLPALERDLYRSNRPDLEWHDEFGDRQTELVVIATAHDDTGEHNDFDAEIDGVESRLRARLTDSLVTEIERDRDEFAPENSFPVEPGEETVLRRE